MKVLLINNFSQSLVLGGVENYLLELIQYATKDKNIEFLWYGNDSKKVNWIQKFYNNKSTKEIKKLIDDFKPDVIHCFNIGSTITPHFMRYAKNKNITILYSFRDYYYICPKSYMLTYDGKIIKEHNSALECIFYHHPKRNIVFDSLRYLKQQYHKKFLNKYVSYFLTPSDNLTDAVKKHFHLEGKTLANPCLLDNSENINTSTSNHILFVGRIEPEKGLITLLKAFKVVTQKFPKEKLVIAGEGTQLEQLEHFKQQHQLTQVEFVGNQNREQLKTLYANAKFVVLPSEFLESYGNTVLEAFSFSKTVIASDLVGIKNQIINSNSGLIYTHNNSKALQKSMQELIKNEQLRKELESNAYTYSKTQSMENHYKNLKIIYNNLLLSN
ncbi:glycosyltransferase family 4 protein [Flavobacterium chuncheonense]|uniref:Glycosyltransferase family 4 protein n=1 Tax=Flavobacterium chuncheonense TaxID=2026653 RepID=A0ABW5YR26_9FLAO